MTHRSIDHAGAVPAESNKESSAPGDAGHSGKFPIELWQPQERPGSRLHRAWAALEQSESLATSGPLAAELAQLLAQELAEIIQEMDSEQLCELAECLYRLKRIWQAGEFVQQLYFLELFSGEVAGLVEGKDWHYVIMKEGGEQLGIERRVAACAQVEGVNPWEARLWGQWPVGAED